MSFLSEPNVRAIRLWEPEIECCMCGEIGPHRHAVAYCCEPTHDEIGSMSTKYRGHEVGGMPACKACHDKHYNVSGHNIQRGSKCVSTNGHSISRSARLAGISGARLRGPRIRIVSVRAVALPKHCGWWIWVAVDAGL